MNLFYNIYYHVHDILLVLSSSSNILLLDQEHIQEITKSQSRLIKHGY